jgi:hypothetical protein
LHVQAQRFEAVDRMRSQRQMPIRLLRVDGNAKVPAFPRPFVHPLAPVSKVSDHNGRHPIVRVE